MAPTITTGLSVSSRRSSRNAVSSMVSVPWVITRPSMSGRSSQADARRASRHICSGVTWGPGRREKSSTSISAISSSPRTWARISSAPSAGTAAPVAGSSFIEIVPPVKRSPIIGRASIEDVEVLQRAAGVEDDDAVVGEHAALLDQHLEGVKRGAAFGRRTDTLERAQLPHGGHHVPVADGDRGAIALTHGSQHQEITDRLRYAQAIRHGMGILEHRRSFGALVVR